MSRILGLAVVVVVAAIAWWLGSNMNSHALSMAVGVLFGMLAGIPTALLVATSRQTQHHTHDVNVRFVPPRVRSAMAAHGANDAVKINGKWVLLDGDQILSYQRSLTCHE